MSHLLLLKNVSKSYGQGERHVDALKDVSLTLDSGENLVIWGPSGSGKTTLLHLIGGLDRPSSGQVWVKGQNLEGMDDAQLSHFRNYTLGFVFQFFYLQNYLTVAENIALPLVLGQIKPAVKEQRIRELLADVGLTDKYDRYPAELSGGEQQRVAVARALVNKPALLLADEPTGNLDQKNSKIIMDLFDKISDGGVSVVVITHDMAVAKHFNRAMHIDNGRMVDDTNRR